jgi:FAD/FMN-containing dehydrogenase
MDEARTSKKISGWGRFPVVQSHVYRPEKRRGVASILDAAKDSNYLACGLGRSYGDAGVNDGGGTINLTRLNRMISFDPINGLLECEAGLSLAEILDVFVPRGYMPYVVPGTKYVTVGGAIANDVHGKNHHQDGAFSTFVQEFDLLTADGTVMTCSRDTNTDVFWATVGGIGLTGIILTAKIRLRPIDSAYVLVDYFRAKNLEEALQAIREGDENYTYSVGWVDCLAKGASLGRCVLMRGNNVRAGELPRKFRDPLRPRAKRQKSVPIDFPSFVLNPLTIKAFNTLYYGLHKPCQKIMDFDSYFFPLDSIHNWNRMYGRRGFGQYQVIIPMENARGLINLVEMIRQSSCASFLAVLKKLGPQDPGMLSFPCEGYTLTLDIPMRRDLVPLLHTLDRHVLECGGRLYCAKDAVTLPETFAAMFPRMEEFLAVKSRLDPGCRFSSTMARRLGIVPK